MSESELPDGSVDAETDPDVLRVRAVLEARLLGAATVAAQVGRFLVVERIGAGAMGVVFSAFDPQLDRKVALKLLFEGERDEAKRMRLLAEARALARLAHPNVVAVYEVGEHERRVFIAMEHVAGVTLRKWASARTRSWREVLTACIQAGRGLAAAHAAGMVHRDFKPDNVLVSDDAEGVRARVLDFGLAREAVPERAEITASDDDGDDERDESLTRLTRTGACVGTPGYMAPEQFANAAVDEAADQFAFCVTLWECLYGQRPFAATSVREQIAAVNASRLRDAPRDRNVPAWVRAIMVRGLAVAPRDRWPSMRALLDALAADPSRRRTRWVTAAAALAVASVGIVGARAWWHARAQRCSGAADQLATAWNDAQRERISAAFAATSAPFAGEAFTITAAAIDAYAGRWIAMHTESCEATNVRGEQSADAMDRRAACLHGARTKLAAAVAVLADADLEVVRNAHDVVDDLAPLERCADLEALAATFAPPLPEDAADVVETRELIAIAEAEQTAGRYVQARAQLEAAERIGAAIDYTPLHAELALVHGEVVGRLGEYDDAAQSLRHALALAARADMRDTMRRAAVMLVSTIGAEQEHFAEGLQFRELALELATTPIEQAQARVHIAGVLTAQGDYAAADTELRTALALLEPLDPPPLAPLRRVRAALGGNLYYQSRFAESEAEARAAFALAEQTLGHDHPDLASARGAVAIALAVQGKLDEAEVEFRTVMAMFERALGKDHPDVANAHNNLGTLLEEQGRYAEAEAETRTAIALWERAFGPDHPSVILARTNLSAILYSKGELDASLAEAEHARASAAKTFGPDAPEVGHAHGRIAAVYEQRKQYADATREYRRSLELALHGLGPEHDAVIAARHNLASVLLAEGKAAEAEAELRQVLAVDERLYDAEQPKLAVARIALAKTLIEQQREAEALPIAELGWARLQRDDIPLETQAEAAFQLARAMWGSAADRTARTRAHALGIFARDAFAGAPPQYRDSAEFVRKWLAAHE